MTRTLAIAKAGGQPAVEQFFAPQMKRTSVEISELQMTMQDLVTSTDGKALMAEAAARRGACLAFRDELLRLVKQADQPGADALMKDKLLPASDAYMAAMADIHKHELALAQATAQTLDRGLGSAGSVLLIPLAVSLLVGTKMAFFITRSVTRPLLEAVTAVRVIASSDLSQPVSSDRRDELGDLLRAPEQMQDSLCRLVTAVRGSTDSIGTASAEIATGTLDLSTRTEQTASNLEQTASSMEQLNGTVRQSADSARQANQLATSAAEVAARGGVVVSQVVATMDEINASSKRIADIIGVITAAAAEQSEGIGQVNTSVTQLDQMTQQNASLVEQSSAAAESLREQASRLADVVGMFRLQRETVGS